MLEQKSFYLILTFVGVMISINQARDSSCQVYPSEYAYKHDSVTRAESTSANCRRYQEILGLPAGTHSMDYIHCDGTPLKLADANLGSEQFSSSNHYQWPAGSDGQLLFTFPARVSLTTITLHYYSDRDRGLSRLRVYPVPDDFDVWGALAQGNPYAGINALPPGGEPAGHRNIGINFNFNTKKVLMYKFSSSFQFAVSEVEFFTTMINCSSMSTQAAKTGNYKTTVTEILTTDEKHTIPYAYPTTMLISDFAATNSSPTSLNTITSSTTDTMTSVVQSNVNIVAIGASIVMLLILSTILIITATVLIWSYKRRSSKKLNNSSPYSTLNRRAGQQQSLQQDYAQLYDQIHLSPSTGQTEYVPNSETANINNQSQQNSHPTYSTAGGDIAEHSSTLNTGNRATTSQLSPQNAHESTSEQPTYAAINTSKKKKFKLKEDAKCKAAEKGPTVLPYSRISMQEKKENATKQEITSPHTIEQLYTAIKKPIDYEPKSEEEHHQYHHRTQLKSCTQLSRKSQRVTPVQMVTRMKLL